MKNFFFFAMFLVLALFASSQNNLATFSSGYSTLEIPANEDYDQYEDVYVPGWRINGIYEFYPKEEKFAFGISIGYAKLKEQVEQADIQYDYQISIFPFCFSPKFLFGSETIKGFIKGSLGGQSINFKRINGTEVVERSDFGIFAGVSAGVMVFVYDNVFLNAEYEIAHISNIYYRDGTIQSATIGVGLRF